MKKALLIMALLISCIAAMAQKEANVFTGYLYNSEYQVFLKINFVEKNVVSETQPLFGEMPGYFGAKRDMREWFITDAKVVNKKTAKLNITNDYGSEDLEARLTLERDGTYTLERLKGSTMKIVVGGKWVNIPKKLTFKRPVATKPAA